ncbi:MAG: ABC transporter ATP-binding protein/permease [Lachnospiraceae bacterium]|nr:ABC transporter ATP-binding protein/permease [Lachnospiraceae bacterium]
MDKVYLLGAENLCKSYEADGEREIIALDNVNYRFPDCGMLGVVGRSGSGKTTLLNMLGGMDNPSSGWISFRGKRIDEFSEKEMDSFRKWQVAYIFQEYNLIGNMSALDNIKAALRFQLSDEKEIERKALKALADVELSGYEKRDIRKMSGGQQQRVAIARAIAKESSIILCDEPTGNLDINTAEEVMNLLRSISVNRLVVIVTHDEQLAKEYCDEIIRLEQGRITENKSYERDGKSEKENEFASREEDCSGKAFSGTLKLMRYSLFFLKRNLAAILAILLIAVVMFTLLITSLNISGYSKTNALYNTIKDNKLSFLPITRYVDKVVRQGDSELFFYGPSAECESVRLTDEEKVRSVIGQDTPLYRSYFFCKSLDDFSERSNFSSDLTREKWFREFVALDDYKGARIELLAGGYPKSGGDVLITDYMADNIIAQGKYAGVSKVSDLVGYTLTDVHTGLAMHITGIIKSDYRHFIEYAESSSLSQFVSAYLGSLQSVWGLTEFVPTIQKDGQWVSVEEKLYSADDVNRTRLENNPFRLVRSIDGLSFIGPFNRHDSMTGVLLTKGQLAELCGVSVEKIDERFIEENANRIDHMSFFVKCLFIGKEMERGSAFSMELGVIGIIDDASNPKELVCYERDSDGAFWFIPNGEFRQFYVGLTGKKDYDQLLVGKLVPDVKTDDYYLSHKDYYREGYMIYSPFLSFVEESTKYLSGMEPIGIKLSIASILLFLIGIIAFGALTIRKHHYEIGLFRSLGAGRWTVSWIFGTELLLVVIAAAVLSVVVSPIVLKTLNEGFTKNSMIVVRLFDLSWKNYLLPAVCGVAITIVAILGSVSMLMVSTPSKLLKYGRS